MDGSRFDDVARALGRQSSRRGVLRALAGVAAGAVIGLRRQPDAAAATSRTDLDLDLLVCVGLNPLLALRACIALNLPHVARAACEGGRCVIKACDPGWADCDGNAATGCETPLGTPENCSGCGDACPSGVCAGGQCADACAGVDCPTCQICDGGTCVADADQVGAVCDDGDPCTENDACDTSGVCVGTPLDCSELDDPCGPGVCSEGTCRAHCPPDHVCGADSATCKNVNVNPECAGFNYCGPPSGTSTCVDDPIMPCVCATTIEGGGVCFNGNELQATCTSSADCPGQQRCVAYPCLNEYYCVDGGLCAWP